MKSDRIDEIGFMIGEKTYLSHAIQLVESIQRNGGFLKSSRIVIMIPLHADFEVEIPCTEQRTFSIPPEMERIPFVDKMFAASAFESACKGSYLWMDVDSIVLKEPISILIHNKIGIKAVDKRNIGILQENPLDLIWKELYNYYMLSEKNQHALSTTISREMIHPYFNVGFVCVLEKRGLFQRTCEGILDLIYEDTIKNILDESPVYQVFFHQAVFTCALLKLYSEQERSILPIHINFPLHFYKEMRGEISLLDLQSVRYDSYFETQERDELILNHLSVEPDSLNMKWYY